MYGQQNMKICNAKQAKYVFQYKNTKINLYKNNAAIWYNKTCRSSLSTCAPDDHLLRVTIPDAESIQFSLLMMSM